jgi:hypothetical protein
MEREDDEDSETVFYEPTRTQDREDDADLDALRPATLYCVIIRHPFKSPQKVFTVILARDPFLAVTLHNQERSQATDMHSAAPFCYLERVAGPFFYDRFAKRFAHELVHGIRGLPSLCRRIEHLADQYGVACYSSDVPLQEPVRAFLERKGAPEEYLEAADRMEHAAEVLLDAAGRL